MPEIEFVQAATAIILENSFVIREKYDSKPWEKASSAVLKTKSFGNSCTNNGSNITKSGTKKSETIGNLWLLFSATATPSLSEPDPTVVGIATK